MNTIEPGTKVEYTHGGKVKRGVVHAFRTYENNKGILTGVSYLVVELPKGKKTLKVTNQHEQIEIDQDLIKVVE